MAKVSSYVSDKLATEVRLGSEATDIDADKNEEAINQGIGIGQ